MKLPTDGFEFDVIARDGEARRSQFRTPHGVVDMPAFMPVGTRATVKGLTPDEIAGSGAQMLVANTYHLWQRPGPELVERRGGVQRFMAWPGAVLTDSGGFQVFSLADLRSIDDDGVTFQSHLDGSRLRLTPEESMRIQAHLRSDVAMVLDVCPPSGAPREVLLSAMERTTRWAERCLRTPNVPGQARFGIVQGGCEEDLRVTHLETIAAMPFDGIALGGFSVGEPPEVMARLLGVLGQRMPGDRPRYVMGIGTPVDLVLAIGAGIDLFDCVLPTRNGRNGQAFTSKGKVVMKHLVHRESDEPLDDACSCPTCRTFSRSYLRHLFRTGEMLGPRLLTLHNLHFYGDLVRRAREAISAGRYASWAASVLSALRGSGGLDAGPDERSFA